jgi:hypothetical protein
VQLGDAELDAAGHGLIERSTGTSYDDQIAEALVENEFYRHTGVDTAEDRGERMLAFAHSHPSRDSFVEILVLSRNEPRVPSHQPLQRLVAVSNQRRR